MLEELFLPKQKKYPTYSFTGYQHEYILITSLNLGGAEKIVTDQLWANSWNQHQIKYTLIVLYEKEKEHPVPPGVNIVRLNGHLENGYSIFTQIAQEDKNLVAHLVNDKVLDYLFSLNVKVNLVLHNDQQGWVNKPYIFNHPNIGSLIAVCHYVERQIKQYTDKPVITVRHQINYKSSLFDIEKRKKYRTLFNVKDSDKVIGMLGRIAWQKNYPKAIEILSHLVAQDDSWKLMIVGGFEPTQQSQYLYLLQLVNHYNLQENIIFTGFRQDAKELINCFDIALNTSHFEGLSMATQELIGNGLKVFCANVCGQEEIIDEKNQIVFYSVSKSPKDISEIILNYDSQSFDRLIHTDGDLENVSKRVWASHRVWNLLQHSGVTLEKNDKFAFLTSNLSLGGAQKSLVNLVKGLKNKNILAPIIVANRSNYFPFYKDVIENEIELFLAHESIDAFDITSSIFNYLKNNNISKLLLWNVDAKLRLLLTKIGKGWLKVIDVSPGHYCFEEMLLDKVFMDGIYYDENEYHQDLNHLVFKYNVKDSENPFLHLTKNKTSYISNGVNTEFETLSHNDSKMINKINLIKKDKPGYNFVICGRISPSKHIEVILNSFTQLLAKNKNINIFIVGGVETEYNDYYLSIKNKFEHLFEKNIFWLGSCDSTKNTLHHFDTLIVLGTHQGCPNIVLESFLSKTLVIANDSGGTRELINNNTGILLPAIPNEEFLTKAMEEVLNNDFSEKTINAFNLLNNNFSIEKMVENYLKIITN